MLISPTPLRDLPPSVDDDVYIGEALFVHHNINRIRPLAVARDDGWHRIDPILFPDEGLVFSVDPAVVGREEGYVVLFTIVPNQLQTGADRFLTGRVCEPYEICLAFENMTPDEQRDFATRKGVDHGLQDLGRIILPLGNGKCAFPQMQFDHGVNGWIVSHSEDLSNIITFEADACSMESSFLIAGRRFALPGRLPQRIVGAVNWESDADCYEAIVRFLNKTETLREGADLEHISKKIIGRLHSAYVQSELLNGADHKIAALHERLATLLPKLQDGDKLVDKIATELASAPPVKQAILDLVQREKQALLTKAETEITSEVRARVDAEFADAKQRTLDLERTIQELHAEEIRLSSQIQELSSIRDERLNEIRASLWALVEQVRKGGDSIVALINAAEKLGLPLPGIIRVPNDGLLTGAPWSAPSTVEPSLELQLDELPATLTAAAKDRGLPIKSVAALDIALRSGAFTVLSGPAADYLLDTYATCVTGGIVHRTSVDPTILGIDDLWTQPSRHQETPFARAWRNALASPDQAVLACLDSLESASLTNWLPDFVAMLARARPTNLMIVAIRRTSAGGATVNDRATFAGIPIAAESSVDSAIAILDSGDAPTLARRTLKAPFLIDMDRDASIQLIAGCSNDKPLAPDEAIQLTALSAAAGSWIKVDSDLRALPRELIDRAAAARRAMQEKS
jgi:hypothetical protein